MAGAVVVSKLAMEASAVRLAVSASPRLSNLVYSAPQATVGRTVRNEIAGLNPDTQYYYALEIDGAMRIGNIGKFRTRPNGPKSFRMAFASCAFSGSNHIIFEAIRAKDPAFFVHLGDLFYADIAVNDQVLFEAAYDEALASPRQAALYRQIPTYYMWDDHDFGPNNSDSTSPSKPAAIAVYKRRVPHPPLQFAGASDPIGYAFDYGRVHFIVTDLRSARTDNDAADDASKTMMGAAQKAWLKSDMVAARDAGKFIVWCRTSPWIADAPGIGELAFATERAEIAEFVKANGLTGRVCILTGDRHCMAIDDGSNGDFAAGGGAPIPSFMASPIDQSNLTPLGTYSEGVIQDNPNVFGVMDVVDDGGATLGITWNGYSVGADPIMSHTFNVSLPPA